MTTLELRKSVQGWSLLVLVRLQRGRSHKAWTTVAVGSGTIFGTGQRSPAVSVWTRQLWQRTTAPSFGECFLHRGLHKQLRLLLVVLVDVLAQLFLLAHNARAGVAEDRATDSGKSADLDSSKDTDRPSEAHAHEGPDHGQASHGDGGVVVVGVVVLHLLP